MAEKKETPANSEKQKNEGPLQIGIKAIKPLQDFWNKFNNDWSWTLSGALAYNLLFAMFPFFLALLAILGFFLGGLDQQAFNRLVNNIVDYGNPSGAKSSPRLGSKFWTTFLKFTCTGNMHPLSGYIWLAPFWRAGWRFLPGDAALSQALPRSR